MFEFLKKLKPKATAEDIAATRATIDLDALRAAYEAATAERAQRLVAGAADSEILAIEARIEAARIAVDRAEIVLADLDRRHVLAVAAEKEAAARAEFEAVEKQVRDAAEAWRTQYAVHASALAGLCEKMRKADHDRDALSMKMDRFECDTSDWPSPKSTQAILGERMWDRVVIPASAGFEGGWIYQEFWNGWSRATALQAARIAEFQAAEAAKGASPHGTDVFYNGSNI